MGSLLGVVLLCCLAACHAEIFDGHHGASHQRGHAAKSGTISQDRQLGAFIGAHRSQDTDKHFQSSALQGRHRTTRSVRQSSSVHAVSSSFHDGADPVRPAQSAGLVHHGSHRHRNLRHISHADRRLRGQVVVPEGAAPYHHDHQRHDLEQPHNANLVWAGRGLLATPPPPTSSSSSSSGSSTNGTKLEELALTFNMSYATIRDNPKTAYAFQVDVIKAVGSAVGVTTDKVVVKLLKEGSKPVNDTYSEPLPSVTVVSLAINFPSTTPNTTASITPLLNNPGAFFSDSFKSTYGVSGVTATQLSKDRTAGADGSDSGGSNSPPPPAVKKDNSKIIRIALITGLVVGGFLLLACTVGSVVLYRRWVKRDEDEDTAAEAKALAARGKSMPALLPDGRVGSVVHTSKGSVLINVKHSEASKAVLKRLESEEGLGVEGSVGSAALLPQLAVASRVMSRFNVATVKTTPTPTSGGGATNNSTYGDDDDYEIPESMRAKQMAKSITGATWAAIRLQSTTGGGMPGSPTRAAASVSAGGAPTGGRVGSLAEMLHAPGFGPAGAGNLSTPGASMAAGWSATVASRLAAASMSMPLAPGVAAGATPPAGSRLASVNGSPMAAGLQAQASSGLSPDRSAPLPPGGIGGGRAASVAAAAGMLMELLQLEEEVEEEDEQERLTTLSAAMKEVQQTAASAAAGRQRPPAAVHAAASMPVMNVSGRPPLHVQHQQPQPHGPDGTTRFASSVQAGQRGSRMAPSNLGPGARNSSGGGGYIASEPSSARPFGAAVDTFHNPSYGDDSSEGVPGSSPKSAGDGDRESGSGKRRSKRKSSKHGRSSKGSRGGAAEGGGGDRQEGAEEEAEESYAPLLPPAAASSSSGQLNGSFSTPTRLSQNGAGGSRASHNGAAGLNAPMRHSGNGVAEGVSPGGGGSGGGAAPRSRLAATSGPKQAAQLPWAVNEDS